MNNIYILKCFVIFTTSSWRWNRLVKSVRGSQKQCTTSSMSKSATLHLCILPVTSGDFFRKNHLHFTRVNICTLPLANQACFHQSLPSFFR